MIFSKNVYYKLSLLITLILISCSVNDKLSHSIKESSSYVLWKHHKYLISNINQYRVCGTCVCIINKQQHCIKFYLQRFNRKHYSLMITNIFGLSIMHIIIKPHYTKLIDHYGKKYIYKNYDTIIAKLIRVNISLDNLIQWITGISSNYSYIVLNNNGYLRQIGYQIKNEFWHVKYSNYYNNYYVALPADIELFNNNINIKVKIHHWELF